MRAKDHLSCFAAEALCSLEYQPADLAGGVECGGGATFRVNSLRSRTSLFIHCIYL
ncbi:MAG: hypothetical protein ABI383_09600 [Acidobacteriaceae bacterium]